jgi:hypothetical protein
MLFSEKGHRLLDFLSRKTKKPFTISKSEKTLISSSFQLLTHEESEESTYETKDDFVVNFFCPQSSLHNKEDDSSQKNIEIFQKEIMLSNNSLQLLYFNAELESKRRKWSTDSIHKKIKRLFFCFIKASFFAVTGEKSPKIPHQVISNVTLNYNKSLFNMNVINFFSNFCCFKKIEGNLKENANFFFQTTLRDLYIFYVKNIIQKDLSEISRKESDLYNFTLVRKSLVFLDFYDKKRTEKKKVI